MAPQSWHRPTKRQPDVHRGSEAPDGTRPGQSPWQWVDLRENHGKSTGCFLFLFFPYTQKHWFKSHSFWWGWTVSYRLILGREGINQPVAPGAMVRPQRIRTSHCGSSGFIGSLHQPKSLGLSLPNRWSRCYLYIYIYIWTTVLVAFTLLHMFAVSCLSDCICILVENI